MMEIHEHTVSLLSVVLIACLLLVGCFQNFQIWYHGNFVRKYVAEKHFLFIAGSGGMNGWVCLTGRKFTALEVEGEGGERGYGTVLANVAEDCVGSGGGSEKKKKVAAWPSEARRAGRARARARGWGAKAMRPFPSPPPYLERKNKNRRKNKREKKV